MTPQKAQQLVHIRINTSHGGPPTGKDVEARPDCGFKSIRIRARGTCYEMETVQYLGELSGKMVVSVANGAQWGIVGELIWIQVDIRRPWGSSPAAREDLDVSLLNGKIVASKELYLEIEDSGLLSGVLTLGDRFVPDTHEPWDRSDEYATAEDLTAAVLDAKRLADENAASP